MNSEQLFERSIRVAPGGVHSPVRAFKSVGGTPVFFKSAQGAYLTSVEDKKYIDFCMSFGPHILGHRHPEVQEVVHQAIDQAWSLGACEPYSLALAEWMTARLPFVEKLRFVCSGTEAVMSAIRVARGAVHRPYILKFEGCYHGHVDSLLVKAGSGLAGQSASSSAGVPEIVQNLTLLADLDNDEQLEKIFASRGQEIAAVILEPLPANYGLLPQRKEYIHKVVDLARKHGALVIFDEVISGFRVGMGGMAAQLGITPDLVTYGKIIGGGFPVGAYAGRADLMDQVAPLGPVYQAGTLSASPVGMQAGLKTLQVVEKENAHAVLEKRTKKFADGLNQLFKEKDYPLHVVSEASLFWLQVKTPTAVRHPAQISAKQSEVFGKIFHNALKQGVYLPPSGYEVGFVSLAHTDEILETAKQAIGTAIQNALA